MTPLTDKQLKDFEDAVKPLIKFLACNFNPHVKVIVDSSSAELTEGQIIAKTDEFIED
jgi:hypothetical protein